MSVSLLKGFDDALQRAGVVAFRRGAVSSRPEWEPASRVGVGVADLADERVREVWVPLPPTIQKSLREPQPGRPLFREVFRRALGSLLDRAEPQETAYRAGHREGTRDAHGVAWEPVWHSPDEDLTRPVENHPLSLLEFLRAPPAALMSMTEVAGAEAQRLYVAEIDLRAMESQLSPLQLRALGTGGATKAALQIAVDDTGLPSRIARHDATHDRREMWTVLELERCHEPFEGVDLFARWSAG